MDYEQLTSTAEADIGLARNAIGLWCLRMDCDGWVRPIMKAFPSREAAIKDALLTVSNMKARDWAKAGKATGWVLMQSDLEIALAESR